MRKNFSFLVLIFLVACSSSTLDETHIITVGIETTPQFPDPRTSSDAITSKINKLLFKGLLQVSEDLSLKSDLAESITFSPDGLTYTVKLRTNVKFHDGSPFDAEDVKATYESIRSGIVISRYEADLKVVDQIITPDQHTVIFKLKTPFNPFLTLLTLGILPSEFAAKKIDPEKIIPGTGAFRVIQLPDVGSGMTIEKITDQQKIHFKVVQDSTLRTMELIKGRLDLVQNNVPPALIGRIKKEKNLAYQELPGINFSYLLVNFKNPHLAHPLVRQAIALAIDREKLIAKKGGGLGIPANSILAPGHWARDADLPTFSFNPELAKKLLDQTPYKDPDGDGPLPRFEIVWKTSTDRERIEIAQLMAGMLRNIGIKVKIRSFEFGTLIRDLNQGDFDLASMTWVGVTSPDIYYTALHSSMTPPSGANRGRYANQDLDTWLVKSRLEQNPKTAHEIYQKIQKIAFDDLAYIPLWYEKNYVFMSDKIKNYQLRADAGFQGL